MNRQIEDRLRAAFEAKADQVTIERLDQLAGHRHEVLVGALDDTGQDRPGEPAIIPFQYPADTGMGDDVTPLGALGNTVPGRHARWFAPLLAAAAVAVIAVAVTAVSSVTGDDKHTPNPAGSQISTPAPSTTPEPSTGAPSAEPSSSPSGSTGAAAPYLPWGEEGSRSRVPWFAVGPGWRLLQPYGDSGFSSTVYLYDPAGGRYLISDRLPPHAQLLAWSPDGERALLLTAGRYDQLQLRSGRLDTGPRFGPETSFVTYSRPRGLAMVFRHIDNNGKGILTRNALDGTLQLTFPTTVAGGGVIGGNALYTADGSALVVAIARESSTATAPPATSRTSDGMVLLDSGGHLIRRFPAPAGYWGCHPQKWWSASSILESCVREDGSSAGGLFLQRISGGRPATLAAPADADAVGYPSAWQLGNGDVLLSKDGNCLSGGYSILHPTGAITALKLPHGVSKPGYIVNMDGNVATFDLGGAGCAGSQVGLKHRLLDYDMVTGQSTSLFEGAAAIVDYPGQD